MEAALRDLPKRQQSCPIPDPLRREEVKAYIKLREGLTKTEVPPDRLAAHGEKRLPKFKIPRYIAYAEDFPRTQSRKIQKNVLIASAADLRADAYDRQDKCWR
jgi:acyl-coenzyme A synthetase/AMP-(fatty) acid ligase